MLILGIDTSCDDTSVSVLREGKEVLSNVVQSQVTLHAPYCGVVPELASREHLRNILFVMEHALKTASVGLSDITCVAVTTGPGLMGSLLVGLYLAKALNLAKGIPIIPVNHLEGHLLSILLEDERPEFPYLALTVSGGHTCLYKVEAPLKYVLLGSTLDDAAGEAFDKVAKLFGLGYPGGRPIEELAKNGVPGKVVFPRADLGKDSLDFSFSGIKTAVSNYLKRWLHNRELKDSITLADMAYAFQEAVSDMLIRNLFLAKRLIGIEELVMVGGVACNSFIRERVRKKAEETGAKAYFPRPAYCTDNGAMIALVGYFKYRENQLGDLWLDASSKFRV